MGKRISKRKYQSCRSCKASGSPELPAGELTVRNCYRINLHFDLSAFPITASESLANDVAMVGMDLDEGRIESLMETLTALYARIPYVNDEKETEANFQNVIYIVFTLLGQFVKTEVHSAKGRADVITQTDDYVYIFEFKRDKTAGEALRQIEDKGYALPYAADKRKLFRIGVSFDSESRTIDDWDVR